MFLEAHPIAAQATHDYPLVIRAEAPLYPPLARMAKITGTIEVRFTVKGGEVVATEAKSGHPFLVSATTENIKTWHFPPEANGTFTATFVYRLEGDETPTMQNPKIEMQLPTFVRITAAPVRPPSESTGKPIPGRIAREKGRLP